MLNVKTVVPGEFAITAQPGPEDLRELTQQGYKTLINNRPDNEGQNQPSAREMRAAAAEHGLNYAHIPVSLDSISRREIDNFHQTIEQSPSPAVAHCGTGKRSYLLWAAGEVLHRGRSTEELVDRAVGIGIDAKELPQIIQRTAEQ
jgi:uncharacterized protein (TIGR01244 family)